MLDSLKFVKGSVSSKDLIPSLSHFVIEDETIRGFNGIIALGSPIPFELSCKPKADSLIKAISNCSETIQLSITPAGKLSIKSGKFKAFIECITEETPHIVPEGEPFSINGEELLAGIKKLSPFIGTDASRPWCEGILFDDESAFATNNVILAEYWTGFKIPFSVNIPKVAIKELIRINEIPKECLVTENSISFLYEGERWLRSQLLSASWPDVRSLLNQENNFKPIDSSIFEGLSIIKPFADKTNKVIFRDDTMSTHLDLNEGACYDLRSSMIESAYPIEMLALLQGNVVSIDWDRYPKPCGWVGDKIRGCIVGLRL